MVVIKAGDRLASVERNARVVDGQLIDQSRTINFRFDGEPYKGYLGDTLASALLANGKIFVGRSIKYHRPRGILSANFEEPNAVMQIEGSSFEEPNVLATRIEIFDGLAARSVNRWPTLSIDFLSSLSFVSRFLPAGFYYKTFFGSQFLWSHLFEPALRRLAGLGEVSSLPDPSNYDCRHIFCDVLIVGGGPAGLAAAKAACEAGADVVLAEDQSSLCTGYQDLLTEEWINSSVSYIKEKGSILTKTVVFGAYEHNYFAAVQRISEHSFQAKHNLRQRLLLIRAKHVILATGSIERPLVFPNNDRPGIYLAGSAKVFLDRYGVRVGKNIVIFSNNDESYVSALSLINAGSNIVAIIDVRESLEGTIPKQVLEKNIPIFLAHAIFNVVGRSRVRAVKVAPLDGGAKFFLDCDALLVSGGWSPTVHLHSQRGGAVTYEPEIAAFVPVKGGNNQICVGGLSGIRGVRSAVASGQNAGIQVAKQLGLDVSSVKGVDISDEYTFGKTAELWSVPVNSKLERKCFIDFQNDTTLADLSLAVREGFTSPEHVKRYTLTGFGTDQGKVSNVNAIGNIAQMTNVSLHNLNPTTFRPPFLPTTFGVLAGRDKDLLLDPIRVTALNDCHVTLGAKFENVGQWKRPWYYPDLGETFDESVRRECLAVRKNVGILDASTLGKIEIIGPDAAEFLNRIYTNSWSNLKVGRIRYGILCREDGMVFDDGTTARLAEDRYLMTTTTGNAAAVLDWLEEWLQTEWPELNLYCTSVTDHWATIALAGPKAKEVLHKLSPGNKLDSSNFPFMTFQEMNVANVPSRVFRISFTGELSYEINIPWNKASYLWEKILQAGNEHGITPYGTEAMHVLRAEKGYPIIGQDTDGTVTPIDLGLARLVSKKKDFLGKRSLMRSDSARVNRKQFVGLMTTDPMLVIPEGSQIVSKENIAEIHLRKSLPVKMEGHVSSSYFSPILGRSIALALISDGFNRFGEEVCAVADGVVMKACVVNSVFYDPDGLRRDG